MGASNPPSVVATQLSHSSNKRFRRWVGAFAGSIDTLFNDPRLGRDAVYTPEAGEPRAAQVSAATPAPWSEKTSHNTGPMKASL